MKKLFGMNKPRGYHYSHLYQYYSFQRIVTVLIPVCLITFLMFSTIIYLNVHRILDLFGFGPLNGGTVLNSGPKKRGLTIHDRKIVYKDFNYLNASTLTYTKKMYPSNVQILFRFPNNVPTKALLLIFHGCGRTAPDWFHTIERQRIVGAAIDLGYGCLVFETVNQFTHCWTSFTEMTENDDINQVWKGLEAFYKEHPHLESLPLFTFGASSGGIFASVFAVNSRYKIQGQIIFIAIIDPEILNSYLKPNAYPPTAWIYMPRDTEFASEERINTSNEKLRANNIPYKTYTIEPITLTPTTFHERIPTITKQTSNYIFYRFQQNKWLDSENELIYNPRRRDSWKTFLFTPSNKTQDTNDILKNLEENKNIIPDFLNTIYGEHEISFERSFEALQWLRQFAVEKTKPAV